MNFEIRKHIHETVSTVKVGTISTIVGGFLLMLCLPTLITFIVDP